MSQISVRGAGVNSLRNDRIRPRDWSSLADENINFILENGLADMRQRSRHEAINNPNIDGAIRTFGLDMVGANGPSLRVESSKQSFNRAAQDLWSAWWQDGSPEIRGRLTGPAILRALAAAQWTDGEFLVQFMLDSQAASERPAFRLNMIDICRLDSPLGRAFDENVFMGLRLDEFHRTIGYFLHDSHIRQAGRVGLGNYREVPADDICHYFEPIRLEQLRGLPLLQSALIDAADLRDYEDQVLDAARAAADASVVMYSDHPDAEYIEVNEMAEMQRRVMRTLPPGWKPYMVDPKQPANNFSEYQRRMLSKIGRPACMPIVKLSLDSSDSNFSSVRFDGLGYWTAIAATQGELSRCFLNRAFAGLIEDGMRNPAIRLPELPARGYRLQWSWPRPPHVDPQKEAQWIVSLYANRLISYQQAVDLANRGEADYRSMIEAEKEIKTLLEENDLPPLAPMLIHDVAPPRDRPATVENSEGE